jgi:hypothetical protein
MGQTEQILPCTSENGGRIAFNGKYLADMLGCIDAETVSLQITTSSSAGVFRGVCPINGANDAKYLQVIMPMFVQWETVRPPVENPIPEADDVDWDMMARPYTWDEVTQEYTTEYPANHEDYLPDPAWLAQEPYELAAV